MQIRKPHLSLNVKSVDASIDFYERLFGSPVKSRRSGHASFDLSEPGLFLVLDETPRTGMNADHFGVLLVSTADLDEAAAHFDRAGVSFTREPTKLWVRDPDGNPWEFFVLGAG